VDEDNGGRVAAEIGDRALFFRQDVRDEAGWIELVAEVNERLGAIDVLVNNAGVVEVGSIEDITLDAYRFTMAVSVDGCLLGCKHVIPVMRQRGAGSIINMASLASIAGAWHLSAYCAAKGAVEALTRSVAAYFAHERLNLRCNSIHPGGMDTPMLREMPAKMRALRRRPKTEEERAAPREPYILGDPVDIANAVLYLASDESRFVNGQKLVVDNGVSTRQH
jgi:3(or 17)beta-hydroxysteroid dehydrogenase